MLRLLLIKGRRELSLTTTLTPPPLKEGGSPYETLHSVVGHHGSDPVGCKRGNTGGGDRLRRSTKLSRWVGRVHPEGRKRCRSGRQYRRPGSSPRGRGDQQRRDKAARRRRRDRSSPKSQSGLALLEGLWTGSYLRPRRREHQDRHPHRLAPERREHFWLHDPGLQAKAEEGRRDKHDRRPRRPQRYC